MFKNTNILFAIIFCNISYSSESNPLDANEQINEKNN